MTKSHFSLGLHCALTANIHDPSVSVVKDGKLVYALEEERLSRQKSSVALFPERALRAALTDLGIKIEDVDVVALDGILWERVGRKKVERYLNALFGKCPPLKFFDHELAHSAGALYSSQFTNALCISLDGNGDGKSGHVVYMKSRDMGALEILKAFDMPNSLGVFYTVMTNYLGFKSIEDEFKVMGMAAYGQQSFNLSGLIRFNNENGDFWVHPGLWCNDPATTSVWEPKCNYELIKSVIGIQPRLREDAFRAEHFDLAASIQSHFTDVYKQLIKFWVEKTKSKNLVLSGGCALNCMANKEINFVDDLFVFPAASDRGLSVGTAYLAALEDGFSPIPPDSFFLGREYTTEECIKAAKLSGLPFRVTTDPHVEAAKAIIKGDVIGWLQGRSELGPRALGARSILALASIEGMRDKVNSKIKFRENYRPFAPALLESCGEALNLNLKYSAFSYMTANVDVPENISSHFKETLGVDRTARLQKVSKEDPLHSVLIQLKKSINHPVLLNTSFNLNGEPNVESPTDAVRTFVSSGLDCLIMNNVVLTKLNA